MKKYLFFFLIGAAFFITGCETTTEITLANDTSGTYSTTTDMSALMGMMKMASKGKESEKLGDATIDTTFMLDKAADSLKSATKAEKELVKKGKCHFQLNMTDEIFIVNMEFPFSDPTQIPRLEKLSKRILNDAVQKQMASLKDDSTMSGMPGMDKMDDVGLENKKDGSVDDYYTMTWSKGIIEKKLNKEKYAKLDDDEAMKGLKEMSSMGAGNNKFIINLPRPAKKATGKNVNLSDDKKKVTIETSADDFFTDPSALEFRIEY